VGVVWPESLGARRSVQPEEGGGVKVMGCFLAPTVKQRLFSTPTAPFAGRMSHAAPSVYPDVRTIRGEEKVV